MSVRGWLGALPCALCISCSGTTFRVDAPLRATTALSVTGPLGANDTQYCNEESPPATDGLPAGKAALVEIGSLRGLVSEPHRQIETTLLFGEAAARDYERFLQTAGDRPGSRLIAGLLALLGLGDVTRPMRPGDDPPDAIRFVLTLPGEATQTTTVTFLATRDGRAISAACVATDEVRVWGFWDDPRFAMRCRILSSADHRQRELNVHGYGSWALFQFSGELHTVTAPSQRAAMKSQAASILGAGAITGFELRTPSAQLAALSFYEQRDRGGPSQPRAWLLPNLDPGWSDALLATLAISHAYPWPTACDTRHLANGSEGSKARLRDQPKSDPEVLTNP